MHAGRPAAASSSHPAAPEPEPLSPYRAALLAGASAEAATAAAMAPLPAAASAASPAHLPHRAPLGDLTNRARPVKGSSSAKAVAAKPRFSRSSGGAASAATAAAATAGDMPQQQRFVPLGSLARRRTTSQQPPCSAAPTAFTEPHHMAAPLPPPLQQTAFRGSSCLSTPPALLPQPMAATLHAVPNATAFDTGVGGLSGGRLPAPSLPDLPRAMQPGSSCSGSFGDIIESNEAAAAPPFDTQQHAAPGGDFYAAGQYPFPSGRSQLGQLDNGCVAGGYGSHTGLDYSAGTAALHPPAGGGSSSFDSSFGSGGRCGGGGTAGGVGEMPADNKQIAPEDAPAWCYKLHVASSQVGTATHELL